MKKDVPYTITLMHCKARQVLRSLFGTNQANGSDMKFVAGATKFNLKNLKTLRYQPYNDWKYESLTNSNTNIT